MSSSPWAVREARERSETPRHADLLDAAARVFAAQGYDGTTVAAITSEAQVARATLYVYFASKEDIFLALAHRVRDDFLASQEPDLADDSPRGILHATVRAYAETILADGPMFKLIDHRADVDPDVAAIRDEISERPIRRFARYIERERRTGRLSPRASARTIAETISYALTQGLIARRSASVRDRTAYVTDVTALLDTLVGLDDEARPTSPRTEGHA